MSKALTLGEVITINRIKHNWSKTYLADELNVSVTAISMYENNERVPTDDKKKILCNLFNISLDELMGAKQDDLLVLEIEKVLKASDLDEEGFHLLKEKLLICFDSEKAQLLKEINTNHKGINFEIKNLIMYILHFIKPDTEIIIDIFSTNTGKIKLKGLQEIKKYLSKQDEAIIISALNKLDFKPISNSSTIPILDKEKNILDYVQVQGNKENYMALRIEDDSMVLRYQPNDIIIFFKNIKAKNGDEVLVSINEKLYLRKIFFMQNNGILLQASNPSYDIINLTKLDIEKKNFKILGIPIEIRFNNKIIN